MTKKQSFHAESNQGDNYQAGGDVNVGNSKSFWFIIPLLILGASSFVLFTSFNKGDNKNIQEIPVEQQSK